MLRHHPPQCRLTSLPASTALRCTLGYVYQALGLRMHDQAPSLN
jgi:hypothetical protein